MLHVHATRISNDQCVGDSTQLLNGTEHTGTKGAIARSALRGRFVWSFRPFATAFMFNNPHSSHTRFLGESTHLRDTTYNSMV